MPVAVVKPCDHQGVSPTRLHRQTNLLVRSDSPLQATGVEHYGEPAHVSRPKLATESKERSGYGLAVRVHEVNPVRITVRHRRGEEDIEAQHVDRNHGFAR